MAAAQEATVIELDTVLVEGGGSGAAGSVSPERANGPVEGVVASRSATGTKTDTPIVETPQSISVVTADQIEILNAQNPSEALRYNAGVQVERFGADPRYDWIKIRGFDAPAYLDGLLLPNSTYATPRYEPYGIERLEVLKGPASVLYGQSPPGGLINFVSKKPLNETQREVEFQVGNHNRFQGAFDFTGPIDDEGTVLYRLIGLGRLSDTEVDFVNDDRAFIAPSFTWTPTAETSLTLSAFYIKDDAKSLQFLPSQGTRFPNPNGQIPRERFIGDPDFDDFEREQWGIGYEFEHRFTESLLVRQNLRYTDVDVSLPVVRGFGFPSVGGVPTNFRNVTRRAVNFDDEIGGLTVDNQLVYDFTTGAFEHTLLAGLDYRQFDSDFKTHLVPTSPLDVFDPDYSAVILPPPLTGNIDQSVEQTGIYVQDQIRYDRLVLLLSGRQDWASNDTRNRITDVEASADDAEFTYRVGALYELDPGISPYLSYSTLFQPTVGVGFSGGLSSVVTGAGGAAFEPTTGDQIEAGVKYEPTFIDGLFTASVFQIVQENVLVADTANPGFQTQAGAVEVRGFEIEGKVSLTDNLDLIASYSYLDSEITENTNPLFVGSDLPVTPNHQAAAFASYTFDSGALGGLTLGAGVRYFGEHWGNLANDLPISSYTLVDAVANYDLGYLDARLEGADIAVNASNLFDKDYVSTCNDLATCYYGNGRQVFGTLRYKW
ncbi:TonB-dependent siderophore receptor [Aurantimonas endophytica]|uniref:Iron complex outermembrane receptor protein n=1 Tax=Aurantimonas endophytica TaxID=1522175 RepID=A0A7W6HGG8_9HYPH|nr:TonB-dependent siderophore receptor [Aurantimonas endophytica]MBB4004736.1 iron complex outermembrane receptor protein [Aurantimonas endophytica]MCO6405550.1 TonB-dependent siderophore receptor [Aurantimonas endophytica]